MKSHVYTKSDKLRDSAFIAVANESSAVFTFYSLTFHLLIFFICFCSTNTLIILTRVYVIENHLCITFLLAAVTTRVVAYIIWFFKKVWHATFCQSRYVDISRIYTSKYLVKRPNLSVYITGAIKGSIVLCNANM